MHQAGIIHALSTPSSAPFPPAPFTPLSLSHGCSIFYGTSWCNRVPRTCCAQYILPNTNTQHGLHHPPVCRVGNASLFPHSFAPSKPTSFPLWIVHSLPLPALLPRSSISGTGLNLTTRDCRLISGARISIRDQMVLPFMCNVVLVLYFFTLLTTFSQLCRVFFF